MADIRKANESDAERIAEIEVFNYRLNFYPIFRNDDFYFRELSVSRVRDRYLYDKGRLNHTYVYDDGAVKGFVTIIGDEIEKLFVEPVLQGKSIGARLIAYATENHKAAFLWALEKNERAIEFYKRNGFTVTDTRKYEENTTEYLVRLERRRDNI